MAFRFSGAFRGAISGLQVAVNKLASKDTARYVTTSDVSLDLLCERGVSFQLPRGAYVHDMFVRRGELVIEWWCADGADHNDQVTHTYEVIAAPNGPALHKNAGWTLKLFTLDGWRRVHLTNAKMTAAVKAQETVYAKERGLLAA